MTQRMNLKQLFADDGAVSPVIGVILMVAITVILAAVIGTFVLGLGDKVGNNAPQASFTFDFTEGGTDGYGGNNDFVEIAHNGGATIDPARLQVSAGGVTKDVTKSNWATDISAGTSTNVSEDGNNGDITGVTGIDAGNKVQVIWTPEGGGSSAIIGEATVPST